MDILDNKEERIRSMKRDLVESSRNVKDILKEMETYISAYHINYDLNKKLIDFKTEISSSLEDIEFVLNILKRSLKY